MKSRAELFLSDMSHNTRYTVLDMASNKEELMEVTESFGYSFPNRDLTVFKGIYGYVERVNLNGCNLETSEVAKALSTIRGKAVDFDHLRKRVVGHWLDAKIEGDEIVCYGIFFRGNFPEDWDTVQECMNAGKLGISFEAWGNREMRTDGNYNLTDIEFAGGALLIETEPAFPGAGVLDMANVQAKILEYAKVMTQPESYVTSDVNLRECSVCGTEFKTASQSESIKCPNCIGKEQSHQDEKMLKYAKLKEQARFYEFDFDTMMRLCAEVVCDKCGEEYSFSVDALDFKNGIAIGKCFMCDSEIVANLMPQNLQLMNEMTVDALAKTIDTFEGSNVELEAIVANELEVVIAEDRHEVLDKQFAVVKRIKNVEIGKTRKIRMFPMDTPANIENALTRLENSTVTQMLRKIGVSVEQVQNKLLFRAKELNMKEILRKYEEATVEEQVTLYSSAVSKIKKLEEALVKASDEKEADKVEADKVVEEKDAEIEEKATAIETLKEEVVEAKKEADEAKAELAKIDKEAQDELIVSRKEALGEEFTKDMTDEDILDDTKFKIASLEKENAELKDKTGEPVKASVDKDLDKGSKDKDADSDITDLAARVREKAYGKDTV